MTGAPPTTEPTRASRRLAAILAADVVGYARLMGLDEEGTLTRLKSLRTRRFEPSIAAHHGRTVKLMGDGALVEFPSAVDAVRCAVEIQQAVAAYQAAEPAERRLAFRVGINVGDVIVEGDDIYGDGVNIASRLEGLAEPGGICVSASVAEQVRNKLDVAFTDLGVREVKNIAQPIRVYGVAFTGSPVYAPPPRRSRRRWRWAVAAALAVAAVALVVAVWQFLPSSNVTPQEATGPSMPGGPVLDVKPVVAVLPFTDQSAGDGPDYFSEGIAEDIIAALGRFPDIAVIARNSSFALPHDAAELRTAVHRLGARYLVEGNVRRANGQVRVAVQLSDVERGLLKWSDRFDAGMQDIFAMQDEITRGIVGALAVRLGRLEVQRTLGKPTDNLAAYDLVLRGRNAARQATASGNYEARTLFRRALDLDPDYPAALVGLGRTYLHGALLGWEEDPVGAIDTAERLAQKAIGLRDDIASAHALLGYVYLTRANHDRAIVELDRAIELNPNDADSYARRGQVLVWSSRTEEGIESFETALRFDPAMNPAELSVLGFGYYLERRYEDAAAVFEQCAAAAPENAVIHVGLAVTYAQLGRSAEAAREVQTARALHPFFDPSTFGSILPDPEHRRRIAEGLRKAGFEW